MHRPRTLIRNWLQVATTEEARAFAKAAGTSVPHLRHIATGRRGISADMAQRLAHASIIGGYGYGFPKLKQQELCAACKRCPLVK